MVRKVAFVTFELAEPDNTGGVGSWVKNSALLLVSAGYEVVIYYILLNNQRLAEAQDKEELWRDRGINLRVVPWPEIWPERFDLTPWLSVRVYESLREESFDIIHFHDVLGLGYGSILAKRSGIAFRNTALCVTLHGSTVWHRGGNGFGLGVDHHYVAHAEAEAIRHCDHLISPSRYMLEWVERQGHTAEREGTVVPNVLYPRPTAKAASRVCKPVEFVFFGRLEPRKGLDLFCEALSLIEHELPDGFTITFLGKLEAGAAQRVDKLRAGLGVPVKTIYNADSAWAQGYLREGGRLAVMPSKVENYPYTVLECCAQGIAFLASSVGGIAEIVSGGRADGHLFEPNTRSLASALLKAVQYGVKPAQLSTTAGEAEQRFLDFHKSLGGRKPAETVPVAQDGVDVFVHPGLEGEEYTRLLEFTSIQQGVSLHLVVSRDDHARELRGRGLDVTVLPQAGFGTWPAWANAAAAAAKWRYGFFSRGLMTAEPRTLAVMRAAAHATGSQAAVAASGFSERQGLRWACTPAGSGPLSAALTSNIFGGFALLLDLPVFRRLGGFKEAEELELFEHWEYLTRLLAHELRVTAVPEPLCDWEGGCASYRPTALALEYGRWNIAQGVGHLTQSLIFLVQQTEGSLSGHQIVQDQIIAAALETELKTKLPFSSAGLLEQFRDAEGHHWDDWCGPTVKARIAALRPCVIDAVEVWQPKDLRSQTIEVRIGTDVSVGVAQPGELTSVHVGLVVQPGEWMDLELRGEASFEPGRSDVRTLSFVLRRIHLRPVEAGELIALDADLGAGRRDDQAHPPFPPGPAVSRSRRASSEAGKARRGLTRTDSSTTVDLP